MNKLFSNVTVLGMPFDDYSSFLKGPAKAPDVFSKILANGSANASTELGVDLKNHPRLKPFTCLPLTNDSSAFTHIETEIGKVVANHACPLTIGGDHSITYPIVKALAKQHSNISILHFDAHPDLYDSFQGNPFSHACPFARIMENNLATRLVQIGIRTLNHHQQQQAEKFSVEVHQMKDWHHKPDINFNTPVYISIDLDALDAAFAPGVSHHEPGGLSVRDILDIIHSIDQPIVGADIVEFNPDRDINGMTAMVAVKLYKELAGKMLVNNAANT